MKQLLRQRLMEYGWRDQMKAYCKGTNHLYIEIIINFYIIEIVKQKGLENITVDELVQEITPKGRGKYLLNISYNTFDYMFSPCTRFN
jgi:enhancer of yellow 2 transcription factor